jgi:hypothetical protein
MSVSRRTCAKDLCEGPVRRTCAKGWGDSSRECLGAQTVRLYPYRHSNLRQEKVGERRIKGANAGLREAYFSMVHYPDPREERFTNLIRCLGPGATAWGQGCEVRLRVLGALRCSLREDGEVRFTPSRRVSRRNAVMTGFPPSTGSASRRKKLFRVEDGRIGIRRSRPLGGFVALRLIRFVFRGAFERWRRDRMLAFVRERDLSPLRQKPSIPMTPLRPIGAAQSGSGSGSSASSSSNRMLRFVFDSDADSDPDTDACGKGSRPGCSTLLTMSGRNVAGGEPARARE